MNIHEHYIKRCIQLAKNGLGRTYPNPMVGSVIVHEGKIIGEGWHQKAGGPHAEVNAINSVADFSVLQESTIYVSLEPCSHYGKTPPCSDLIIARGIKKVVIGTVDPFAEVAGRGIKKLLDAGCEVIVGVLEKECQALNKRFFTFHLKKRPFIILKWAQTQDHFIAPEVMEMREPVWISNKYSSQLVHKWRSEEMGILVGTNTALKDNPQLSTRLWQGNNPVRIMLDRKGKIPRDSHLFDDSVKTILLTEEGSSAKNIQQKKLFIEFLKFEKPLAPQICNILYEQELQSVIIEGGRKMLQTFIDENFWDEARVFTGKKTFGKGIKVPNFSATMVSEKKIETDILKIYNND